MKSFNVTRNILACLGIVFVLLLVYTKFTNTEHWNKETGIDSVQRFSKAYISLQDGRVIIVNVRSWRDFDDSEQLQVTSTNGITYLTHSSRIVLTDE